MFWEDKKVVVTGGGGFLGSRIVARLCEMGCRRVVVVGRSRRPEMERRGVEVRVCDLRDGVAVGAALGNADVVFHCAAKAGVWGSWKDYFETNVIGTRHVLAACHLNGAAALIHTSSPSAVCPFGDYAAFSGDGLRDGAGFLCHYARSKALAERDVLAVSASSLRVVVIRPPLIWGPGDPHLLPRLIDRARKGRLIQVGTGENLVDLTYIDNAAEAHLLAAERLVVDGRPAGKAYFISDDAPVRLWGWLGDFLVRLGLSPCQRRMSFRKAYAIGAVCEGIFTVLPFLGEPPMTRFVAGQLAHSRYFDISAAKADFGYKPVVAPELALNRTVDFFRRTLCI